ncbi:2-hydroxyacid dehydrogenase [Roseomonas sp. OT10]|uniref:2-hydroxyacid dehydrogenase n=1 Tax=Roseomonas cutis TaxID=2897332 RepID=UPI001E5AA075|nr:2-hydroxyacid dehydrogenase [Roseomonas sp. OT10]UFN47508.1 2-hydroxyacid dehydrogenase [Roseomonas sp. OT10]
MTSAPSPSRIVVVDALPAATVERLRALLPPGFTLEAPATRDLADLHALLAGADFLISGQREVDAALLRAAPKARLLHKWGVGVDNFDLDAARAQGIAVARTTGSNAVPVAEYALALTLALLRNLASAHARLSQGEWRGLNAARPALLLSGKTVGIVGFGAIGQTLARLLAGFGCRILYNKTRPLPAAEEAAKGVAYASLDTILAEADVVSLHCPLTPQTRGLIDAAALRRMKPTAILVNVARGGVVVESDLVEALREGVILGAAMDVYETEPVPPDHPLLRLDNVVVTPHIAALSADTFEPTVRRMFANIARHAAGEPIPETDRVG